MATRRRSTWAAGQTGGTPATGGDNTGGMPVGGTPVGGTPVGGSPVGGTPVGGTPVGGAPVGGEPVGGAPVGGEPVGGAVVGGNGGEPVGGAVVGGNGGEPVGGAVIGGSIGGNGGEPVGGAVIGGNGGEPVGGEVVGGHGGEPVGGVAAGGSGGEPVADAAIPDAAPPEPDAAPLPVYTCGDLPVLDLNALAEPIDATHWRLVDQTPANGSEVAGNCGGNGPEKIYGFTAPADGAFRFDTLGPATDFDTVLYLLNPCPSQPDGLSLRCSDDVGPLGSGVVLTMAQGEVLYVVVDSFGPTGGQFELTIGQLPVRAEHDVCDAGVYDDACDEGLYCFALNRPGQPPAEQGTCVPASSPPTINNVTALRNGDVLNLAVDGSDREGDVQNQYFLELLAGNRAQVIDPATGQTEIVLTFAENLLDQQNFVGTARLNVFPDGAWPNTTAVRIRVIDGVGGVSESVTAQVAQQPVVAANQPCDLRFVLNACAEGSWCVDGDGPDGPVRPACRVPTAPVLNSVTATYNEANGALALTYTGTDPDRDVIAVVTGFYDGAANFIEPPGNQQFAFDELLWNGNAFTGRIRLLLGVERFNFATMGTIVGDSAGLGSNAIEVVQFGAPAVVQRGGVCDLYSGGRDVCSAGNLCYSDLFGAADGTCQAPVAACPAGWEVEDLTASPVGAEWRFEGSLADAVNLTTASCARMSGQDVFTFTAERAGTFRFRTESDEAGADTSIFVRSFCRYSDFGAELGCNDDVSPQNFLSDVSLDLQADETVYVFVGGVNTAAEAKGSWRGRYRLIAARR